MDKCLLFFSGGKDSFIATCRLIIKGYNVELISFNNGSIVQEENFSHGANRLIQKFGDDVVSFVGVVPTIGSIQRYFDKYANLPLHEIAKSYPYLRPAQLQCLLCQSAMWVSGIAYCKAKDIKYIATGYRSSDIFCTGHAKWVTCMKNLANSHSIEVELPIWNTEEWDQDQGYYRNCEMARYGFSPAVLEPWCTKGMPSTEMSIGERENIEDFYNKVFKPNAAECIQRLIPIYTTREFTGVSHI